MTKRRWKSIRALAPLLVCLVSVAWADDTLTLQNAGAGAVMGGVYTSPYGISVGNTSNTSLMICDDFETDIYLGYSWSANPTTLTQINSSTVSGLKFANPTYSPAILGGPGNVVEDYATAAVLAAELMTLPNVGTPGENTEAAGVLSYAIWSLFDNSLYTSLTGSNSTPYGSLTGGEVNAVSLAIANAQSLVAGATTGGNTNLSDISVNGQSINSLTVYTPNPLKSSQEFLQVSMPEPSYPSVLFCDLLAVGCLFFVFRKKLSRKVE